MVGLFRSDLDLNKIQVQRLRMNNESSSGEPTAR